MLKDKNIIAFGGFRNTGKDTSASMLQFMLNTPSIFHYYWIFKHFSFLRKLGKWKVTSFARPLKEVLSIILGVPVEKFEDRDFQMQRLLLVARVHNTPSVGKLGFWWKLNLNEGSCGN